MIIKMFTLYGGDTEGHFSYKLTPIKIYRRAQFGLNQLLSSFHMKCVIMFGKC